MKDKGGRVEVITRAVSRDLKTWMKQPDLMFFAPEGFEAHDWRDPFVFRHKEAQEYRMLITARHPHGPTRRRGLLAQAGSQDLKTWEMRPDFWAPHLANTHECADLFRIGEWWYLLFSDFYFYVTEYRMSRSPDGPWQCPPDPLFDAGNYYAAKTAGSGRERFLFGWVGTREGDSDFGGVQWGGDLVVHQLVQNADGTLSARLPASIAAAFEQSVPLSPQKQLGHWSEGGDFHSDSPGQFSVLTLGELPASCLVEAAVRFDQNTRACGLWLRADENLEQGYELRLEPARGRVVFQPFPPNGDRPFLSERPLKCPPGQPIKVQIIVDETVFAAYLNGQIALSGRMCNRRTGSLGLFVSEGDARFESVSVKTRRTPAQ